MKSLIKFGTVLAVASLMITGAFAQGKMATHKHIMRKATMVSCPVCKMPVSAKMTKDNPRAVKVNGKVMYCCAAPACKMPASMMAKSMGKKKGMKKHMMKKGMAKKK